MAASPSRFPIVLKLATGRTDGGITNNYRVYEGGGVTTVKNARGEAVNKNVILGGNGTIYVANDLAGSHTEFVLLPRADFDRMTGHTQLASPPSKGKKGK